MQFVVFTAVKSVRPYNVLNASVHAPVPRVHAHIRAYRAYSTVSFAYPGTPGIVQNLQTATDPWDRALQTHPTPS